MARRPKPWFWRARAAWFVTLNGDRQCLGPDKKQAFDRFYELMRQPAPSRKVDSRSLVAVIDAFLEWVQKQRSPHTYEWYRYRLERLAQKYPDLPTAELKPYHVQQWVDGYPNLSRTSRGYGNVPFHRTEFTAKTITAFFSIDLAQIRGYGLWGDATKLLEVLSLWKIRKFLDSTMRLRTACELEMVNQDGAVAAARPSGFELPATAELAGHLKKLIAICQPLFADPAVTRLTWSSGKKAEKKPKGKKEV